MIERRPWLRFHSALERDGAVYGALFYSERDRRMEAIFADAVVVATGGQNKLFGKTTGSVLSDGYAAGRLFLQGVRLKNLEFIRYHPTTIETAHKRMLITEGARGDGGRLYYLDGGERVYFMEDLYGPRGNLMPRFVVAACIHEAPSQVYLDISFLGERAIRDNLGEVLDVCRDYLGIDVTRESILVAPSVHFFMGGIAVDGRHRTNLGNLYAVGECASIYHGANRLGGNSLLAALHSGRVAAASIDYEISPQPALDFSAVVANAQASLDARLASESTFSAVYLHNDLAQTMRESLDIVRDATHLEAGIASVDYYLSICEKIRYDSSVSPYQGFSLPATMALARAVLESALSRRESRGAHRRSDFPERSDEFACCSFISYDDGAYTVSYGSEDDPCW